MLRTSISMPSRVKRFAGLFFLANLVSLNLSFGDSDVKFFESKIRPLLEAKCIACHSDDSSEGGLSLQSKQGWIEREVILPGQPQSSLLIRAVRYQDIDLQMPPLDSEYSKLTDEEIRDLENWIQRGAIDPRTRSGNQLGPKLRPRHFEITQKDLSHWAYQPIELVSNSAGGTDPSKLLDSLIDERLRELGIPRSKSATPRELVRRAYFDLWGLPPPPDAVAEFERQPTDQAWSELIEKLLSSSHYGEKWGRFWLDLVRYAETNGYERDGLKPNAWRYRDYVIRSFNNDKPYNRFLTEQLAGDLLIETEKLALESSPEAWRNAIVATGFYRLHVWDDEPDSTDAAELDDLDDIIVTTGAAVLGMTWGCARCHDHKYDPLSQTDYYSLLNFFRDIDPYGASKKGGGGRATGQIERFLCSDEMLANWRADQQTRIADLEATLDAATDPERSQIEAQIQFLQGQQPPFDRTLAINAPPQGIKPTFVLNRGDIHSPLHRVDSAIPTVFQLLSSSAGPVQSKFNLRHQSTNLTQAASSAVLTRLDLAQWLTSNDNPLTARVLANRVWLHHFGNGIVRTPDDFGFTGIQPDHVGLLDFLAAELIRGAWSIKHLHRIVMNSNSYRMSSRTNSMSASSADMRDVDNHLFWRQNLRRLDAESMRDSMLFYSGELDLKDSGPSVYPSLSPELRESANPVSLSTWETSPEDQQCCRSVFLAVKRSLKDSLLESFDFANSHSPVGQRPITTIAPQALMLLNDQFVSQRCRRLAECLIEMYDENDLRLAHLWSTVYQRDPTTAETEFALRFIEKQSLIKRTEAEIWEAIVRVVFNSNECIYID